jgi:hypothetical protein
MGHAFQTPTFDFSLQSVIFQLFCCEGPFHFGFERGFKAIEINIRSKAGTFTIQKSDVNLNRYP